MLDRTRWLTIVQRRELGLDLIRVYLGVALLVRGGLFITDPTMLAEWIRRTGQWFLPVTAGHLVAIAHVGGGIFLALGLLTRVAAAIQVVPLLGAVLFVHWDQGLMQPDQSLELSGLVLAILIVLTIFGAGRFSVDSLLSAKKT